MTNEEKWEIIKSVDDDICYHADRWFIPGMTADDIAQELRVWLLEKLDKFNPEKSGIRTFCNLCIKSRLHNLRRDENRKPLNKAVFLGDDDLAFINGHWVIIKNNHEEY
jgi:RNA polymerase sigma factor (sigma-70 family)